MKKIKQLVVLAVLIFTQNNIQAQQNLTLYNMHNIPQSMYANPSMIPYSRVNVGLPLISSIYFNKSNSGYRMNDLIRKQGDSTVIDFGNLVSKLKDNNYFTTAFQVDLLSFGFKVKKNYFSFNATQKVDMRFRYPKSFFNFLWKGNGDPDLIGQEQKFNFGLDASHYTEFGLGYVREIQEDKFSIGGRFKLLKGQENINTSKSDVSLYTDPNTFDLTATSDILINTSGLDSASLASISDPVGYLLGRKNTGFGVDLGATYKVNDEFSFNASVIDLGFINWKENTHNFTSKNPGASFTYRGIDLNQFINDTTTIDNAFDKIADSLNTSFAIDTSLHNSYKTKLSTQIYVGTNYHVNEKNFASLTLYGQLYDKKLHPGVSLAYNTQVGRWMSASISYSIYNRSYNNVGLGMSLNAGPLQWYIVTDNVLSMFIFNKYRVPSDKNGSTSYTNILYPGSAKNFNVRLGFNLTFGRKPKDKDKDGIVDKKDDCPEVFGLAIFNGCPDRDGDGIMDKQDSCVDVAGLKEFNGCPDRDGDKIIDKLDSCVDVAGIAEFNGCPDRDGDKIIDSKDKCPDVPGLKEFAGCPDKDGDGIQDSEDKCPNDPGLKEFEGCPDKDGDKIIDSEDLCPEKAGPASNKGCPEVRLYMLDNKLNTITSTKRNEDGYFVFDKLPSDDVRFRLEGENTESIKDVFVIIGGQKRRAVRASDGYFVFEKLATDVNKLGEMKDIPVELKKEEAEIIKRAFDNLEFETGKDIIKPESLPSLTELAGLMAKKPFWKLKISGHTDNVGKPAANLALSKKRSIAVKKFITSKGVDEKRLIALWFGQTKPIADNKTPEGRQKNRRVEMLIVE